MGLVVGILELVLADVRPGGKVYDVIQTSLVSQVQHVLDKAGRYLPLLGGGQGRECFLEAFVVELAGHDCWDSLINRYSYPFITTQFPLVSGLDLNDLYSIDSDEQYTYCHCPHLPALPSHTQAQVRRTEQQHSELNPLHSPLRVCDGSAQSMARESP